MDRRKLDALRRHRGAMGGLVLLGAFVLLSGVIVRLSPYDPISIVDASRVATERLQSPSLHHLLGTDHAGRDLFTRIFVAARLSLLIGTACVLFSLAIGVPLGALAGYFGGWVDVLISRLVDILLSFPSILLAIAIAASMGAGVKAVLLSVGVVGMPQFARQVRASVLSLREEEFVTASRALGASEARILFLRVLPNALGPVIVLATLGVGSAILTAAGLSFIGLGVEAGTPEWGAMLHDGFIDHRTSPWPALFSGLAISLSVLGFNLFGDGLRDALDPRTSRG
jgi:peptide/nickel transport system permease protein